MPRETRNAYSPVRTGLSGFYMVRMTREQILSDIGIGSGVLFDNQEPLYELDDAMIDKWLEERRDWWEMQNPSFRKTMKERILLSYSLRCHACSKRFRAKKWLKDHKLKYHSY
jgi:hypothetical protein